MSRPKVTYSEIIEANYERISEFYASTYYAKLKERNEGGLVKNIVLKSLYVDPDRKKTDVCKETKCTLSADGLVSVHKLYEIFDGENGLMWLNEYIKIRKEDYVCLYWPMHWSGVNSCKSNTFADRIDYTLFDIKSFFKILKEYKAEGDDKIKEIVKKQCKLGSALVKEKTYSWLRSFGEFKVFIERRRLMSFVNKDFEVIDLETEEPIKQYREGKNRYKWGIEYYNNLKKVLGID